MSFFFIGKITFPPVNIGECYSKSQGVCQHMFLPTLINCLFPWKQCRIPYDLGYFLMTLYYWEHESLHFIFYDVQSICMGDIPLGFWDLGYDLFYGWFLCTNLKTRLWLAWVDVRFLSNAGATSCDSSEQVAAPA